MEPMEPLGPMGPVGARGALGAHGTFRFQALGLVQLELAQGAPSPGGLVQLDSARTKLYRC